jgi:hypothetical protein
MADCLGRNQARAAPQERSTQVKQFKDLRRAGVPLAGIESADPAATMRACVAIVKEASVPVVCWDIIRGLFGITDEGVKLCNDIGANPLTTGNPSECLSMLAENANNKSMKKIDEAVIFFNFANRIIDGDGVVTGIWNCREPFKQRGITMILLGPIIKLPNELKQDIVVLSEPLPDDKELERVANSIVDDAGLKREKILDGKMDRVIDTLRGLSSFAAEQVIAMSLSREGIDLEGLWERKRRMIEQTPGLQVWKGNSSFDQLGGLENLKTFLTRVLTSGKTPVRAVGFIDEIEKALGGASGDTSGTSQDQLGVLLKVMQDEKIPGIILIGPPGTGKSEIAKAAGNVADAPVISIDTGAMKGSLVGESEGRIRAAMDVFKSVSQGKGIFIATCNKIASLPPELRRRFTLGTFFVDLPNESERAKIWPLGIKRYGLEDSFTKEIMDMSNDWSGAEIMACCDVASRTGFNIEEASKFVVPVIKSAPDQVKSLRQMASGRFISANRPGVYEYREENANVTAMAGSGQRRINVE